MTAPGGPPPDGPPVGPQVVYVKEPGGDRTRLVMIAIIAVLVLVAGVAGSIALSRNKTASAAEVSLDGAAQPGADPYTASVATPPPSTTTPATTVPGATTTSATTTPFHVAPATGSGVRTYVGGQPGLYGGTRDYHSCDPDRMITYLYENPGKLAAWADAEGIGPSAVRSYIHGLTSVLLRTDTWVMNHGYVDGHATAHQSVLEAGTAVMVDAYGVPRVKCFCGNPLTALTSYSKTPHYRGTPWYGFDPHAVVIIQQNITIINEITVIDVDTGQPFHRHFGPAPDTPAGSPTTEATTTAPQTTTAAPTTATTSTTTTNVPSGGLTNGDLTGSYATTGTVLPGSASNCTANPGTLVVTVDGDGTGRKIHLQNASRGGAGLQAPLGPDLSFNSTSPLQAGTENVSGSFTGTPAAVTLTVRDHLSPGGGFICDISLTAHKP